jgi:cytidyltransferase-like protein
MQIIDIFEENNRRIVVTYPGRFQPFHKGHAEVFRELQSQFGSDNVFIVTSNKTDTNKSPFNFSDKSQLMAAAGVPAHSVVEASQVYDLPSQFDTDKENIVFITAVGAPDAARLAPGTTKKDGSPAYFQKWEGLDRAQSADKHGYVIITSEKPQSMTLAGKKYDVSHGTPTRRLWNEVRGDQELKRQFIEQLYGQYTPEIEQILNKIPAPTTSIAEDAAGVGVVKNGNDPRYMTSTMGVDNDVDEKTLGKMMKAYHLTGRNPANTRQVPVKETALNPKNPKDDYNAKRRALQDLGRDPRVDQKAVQQRFLDLEKEAKSKGVSEGEYDSRKPFGVRYKVFAGREGRVTTKEYWTTSSEKLEKAVAKIEALGNFYEIDGYSYPKEKQGVAEGSYNKKDIVNALVHVRKTIKQIHTGQMTFPPGFASELEITLYDAINALRNNPDPGVQNTVAELSDLRAAAKQVQTGREGFPPGYASRAEWVLYDAIIQIENQQDITEDAEDLNIGDPVIITGNVEFQGKTGDIDSFGKDKRFVVVHLYNHGKRSFHSSDVSYNDYADKELDEAARPTDRTIASYSQKVGEPEYYKLVLKNGETHVVRVPDDQYTKPRVGDHIRQWVNEQQEKIAQHVRLLSSMGYTAEEISARTAQPIGMVIEHMTVEEKIKGVDGKACWPGKRYAGRKKKPDGSYKDICIPVKEQEDSVGAVESAIIRRIMGQHRDVLSKYGIEAVMDAAKEQADWVGDVDEIGSSDVSAWTRDTIRSLQSQDMDESMFSYNREDPFDSEFAPDVGMGRMTLRGWKQSLARRLQQLSDYAQEAASAGNIDKAAMWENIYKKMQNLNLDPIAKEIELAHAELENIRRQGGVRSRAFREKEQQVKELQENWKKKLGALGLAGAISMGATAPAQADAWDDIMKPVNRAHEIHRDIGNMGRNVDLGVSKQVDRVGRDLDKIPFFGVDKFGRQLRGNEPTPLTDKTPGADERAERTKELNRQLERERAARRAAGQFESRKKYR